MSILSTVTFDMDDLGVLATGYNIKTPFTPVVYDRAVPRMLEALDEAGIKATFFVIAGDIDTESKRGRLREIASCGHEIANHSFAHGNLLGFDRKATREDTVRSTQTLGDIIGAPVLGYRGPSLSLNEHLLEILEELGYEYDSSANPTVFFFLEWVLLYLRNIGKKHFLSSLWFKHALAKSSPYPIAAPSFFKKATRGQLLELPISHVPYLNVPFYATVHFMVPPMYPLFRRLYFTNRHAVYHAHALDFLDLEHDGIPPAFSVHPALKAPPASRRDYFARAFADIRANSQQVVTALEMARALRAGDPSRPAPPANTTAR